MRGVILNWFEYRTFTYASQRPVIGSWFAYSVRACAVRDRGGFLKCHFKTRTSDSLTSRGCLYLSKYDVVVFAYVRTSNGKELKHIPHNRYYYCKTFCVKNLSNGKQWWGLEDWACLPTVENEYLYLDSILVTFKPLLKIQTYLSRHPIR